MPQVVIDGKSYEFEGKHMLLQFAMDNGVEIPYFCYHPSMSIPTNCRMCLVEVGYQARDRATGDWVEDEEGTPVINWGRKPNTACNTPVSDRMYVRTHKTSDQVSKDQKGVLEYMLVNHPLDCPICDQAGECPLQIWTFKYGPEGSRYQEMKTQKNKRVELGPRVMLDEERCINCTRCVRFTDEISKSHQLTIIGRGDKNYPGTPPGETFDDAYSMNTIDLCPVGALTSRQHRFHARPWEMSYAPSIDMNDSTGTNVYVWLRDNKVMRLTPRQNEGVNAYWMADAHRVNIDMYNENRVSGVKVNGADVEFETGIEKAGNLLKGGGNRWFLLGSAHASFESNYALRELANKIGVTDIYYVPDVQDGHGDGWLIADDRTPNAASCELLGFQQISASELADRLDSGSIEYLYSLENDRVFGKMEGQLKNTTAIIHATQLQDSFADADILLPAATSIEGEGVYINDKGMAQASTLGKQIRQMTPDMWMRVPKGRLDKVGQLTDNWRDSQNIFDVLPSWLLISKVATAAGMEMKYAVHKDIYSRVQPEFEVLKDLKISYKPPKESFKISQFEFAIG